jgi:hypothetical protein
LLTRIWEYRGVSSIGGAMNLDPEEPGLGKPPGEKSRASTLRKEVNHLKRVLAEKTLEVDFFRSALQKVEARRQQSNRSGEKASTRYSEHFRQVAVERLRGCENIVALAKHPKIANLGHGWPLLFYSYGGQNRFGVDEESLRLESVRDAKRELMACLQIHARHDIACRLRETKVNGELGCFHSPSVQWQRTRRMMRTA